MEGPAKKEPMAPHRAWSRWAAALVKVGLVLGAGATLTMGEACGTATMTAPDATTNDVAPVCLVSLTDNGKACSAPATQLCPVAIACNPTPQVAQCYCTGGSWQCSYGVPDGGIIAPGSAPKCFNEIGAMPGLCPTREPPPNELCSTAGLICAYTGLVCSGSSRPNTDTCQCSPPIGTTTADGAVVSELPDGGSLVWICERELCNPTSDASIPPPPDTGPPDTGKKDSGPRDTGPPDMGTPKDVKTDAE
jgi:hypothetical protein